MFPVIHSQLAVAGLYFAWLTLHKGTSGKLEYKAGLTMVAVSKKPAQKCLIMEIWGIFSDLCTQGPQMSGTVLGQIRLRAGNIKYKMSAATYQLHPWFVCHMCHCPVQSCSNSNNQIFVPWWKNELFGEGSYHCSAFLLSRNLFWMCVVFFSLGSSKFLQDRGDSSSSDSSLNFLLNIQTIFFVATCANFFLSPLCAPLGKVWLYYLCYPMKTLKTAGKLPLTPVLF